MRNFYRLVNNTRMGFKSWINICRITDGELATNKTEMLGRWKEYFRELLEGIEESTDIDMDGEELIEGNSVEDNQEGVNTPTVDEVEEAIDKLKNNKAPGPDNINSELTKIGKVELFKTLLKVICKVWETENIPQEREEGVICPIHKKVIHYNVQTIEVSHC
jgi:hypothetical protein